MAHIGIDLARRIGTVDRRIFGSFIEHLGRCIYGGVYDEGSPLSDERGFRTDVLDAARGLRIPILRWPGGNFVSGYHWLDGVGPKDARPRRSELAWHAEESNRFGTNEFVEYCRVLGTEPYICVNMGSGTMDEAQAWVEYCNGTGNTAWADLRRQHGYPEPHRVRYWGLGNEMYGSWQIGNTSAHDYVKKARAFALVMKRTDPSIQLIGCGHNGWSEWDEIVLSGLAEFVDYHSVHLYTGCADHYATVFERTGFRGGINWYRNLDRNRELHPEVGTADPGVPCLMISAEWDPALPPALAANMPNQIADLEMVTIPKAGHWVQQESPDEVNAALCDWLSRRFG